VQVDGPPAPLLRVQVDLPDLAQGVRLDEVPLVVDVESVIDRMVLEFGNETGDVYSGQEEPPQNRSPTAASVGRQRELHRITGGRVARVTDDALLDLLRQVATAVRKALDGVEDWGLSGRKEGQYSLDVAADRAALEVLDGADVGVLSEETGFHHPDRELWVALDPVDGSTNASRRLPWYATSACVLDADGPRVALVVNQATGDRFEAVRDQGAWRNDEAMEPTDCTTLSQAVVGLTGCPPAPLGWRQVRALGAAALDICAVASGALDAYIDFSPHSHGSWDYLGAVLVCREAGAQIVDAEGRDLVVRDPADRRCPVAAATPSLLDEAVAARSESR
jgi:myo-inositol-1(or 4)-monophosphatase